jgi:hypothetical protein
MFPLTIAAALSFQEIKRQMMSAPIAFLLIQLHENKIRTLSRRVHPFVGASARISSRAPHVYGRY